MINPAELGLPPGLEWIEYMRGSMIAMMLGRAEALAMLPGWRNSDGAQAEWVFGMRLGFRIDLVESWLLEVTP